MEKTVIIRELDGQRSEVVSKYELFGPNDTMHDIFDVSCNSGPCGSYGSTMYVTWGMSSKLIKTIEKFSDGVILYYDDYEILIFKHIGGPIELDEFKPFRQALAYCEAEDARNWDEEWTKTYHPLLSEFI